MREILKPLLPVLLFCGLGGAAFADQGPYPATQEELEAEYDKLVWERTPGSHALEKSHSTATLGQGRSLLLGTNAERALFLMNGVEFPATEAILFDNETGVFVSYEFFEEGFVRDEDWKDIDAAQLLADLKAGTEEGNRERKAKGIEPLTIKGWLVEPSYDATTHTVRWAVELAEGDGVTVNSFALKLGRLGYEQFTWVGDREDYDRIGKLLAVATDGQAFDEGHRYGDFAEGDKVAAYGLGALVAAAAGAKLGKGLIAALIAFGLILLKKAGVFIALAFGGLLAGFRKLFRRKPKADETPQE